MWLYKYSLFKFLPNICEILRWPKGQYWEKTRWRSLINFVLSYFLIKSEYLIWYDWLIDFLELKCFFLLFLRLRKAYRSMVILKTSLTSFHFRILKSKSQSKSFRNSFRTATKNSVFMDFPQNTLKMNKNVNKMWS